MQTKVSNETPIRQAVHTILEEIGEDPERDSVEHPIILILPLPIRVQGDPNSELNSETVTNIGHVQLVIYTGVASGYSRYFGRNVEVTGSLIRRPTARQRALRRSGLAALAAGIAGAQAVPSRLAAERHRRRPGARLRPQAHPRRGNRTRLRCAPSPSRPTPRKPTTWGFLEDFFATGLAPSVEPRGFSLPQPAFLPNKTTSAAPARAC